MLLEMNSNNRISNLSYSPQLEEIEISIKPKLLRYEMKKALNYKGLNNEHSI